MRSKGEITISQVVLGVIALFVIVLALFFVFRSEIVGIFDSLLPTFNGSTPRLDSELVVRYSLADGTLSYFGGKEWKAIDSSGSVSLNKKQFSVSELSKAFNLYFSSSSREKKEFSLTLPRSDIVDSDIDPAVENYPVSIRFLAVSREGNSNKNYGFLSTTASVYSLDTDPRLIGNFIIAYDGSLYYSELSKQINELPSDNSLWQKELARESVAWRDSVLLGKGGEQAILVAYTSIREGEESGEVETQLEKIGDYLVIRLKDA